MLKMICINCPNGCELTIDDNKQVSGNLCNKGKEFALNELSNPKRTLTTTIKTVFPSCPVVSVRTNKPIKKGLIFEAMHIINNTVIDKKLHINDVVINNILDSGVDIIITTNILEEI